MHQSNSMSVLDDEIKEGEDKFHILYEALMKDDVQKVFEELGNEISKQMLEEPRKHTVNEDTLLHIAIYSDLQEKNVNKILDKLTPETDYIIKEPNKLGDTILHEVAGTNMWRLAKKLIEKDQELLLMRNQFGEIPLFKAVQLGYHDTFCCLADEMKKRYPNEMHNKSLFSRKSKFGDNKIGDTILHQAILNESFGIALKIIKWFPGLVNQRNEYNLIGLQLLSGMTSAFKSGRDYGPLERLIYYCLPNQADKDVVDDELGNQKYISKDTSHEQWSLLSFAKGIPIVKRIKQEKRKHQHALKLAKYLIAEDLSWDEDDKINPLDELAYEFQPIVKEDDDYQSDENESDTEKEKKGQIFNFPPLLVATSRGIVEIVDEILRVYPQAIDVVSSIQQNILHISIKHRQLEIFERVKNNKMSLQRLVRRIDKNGNSILHLVGNLTYSKAIELAPAFQLQEELNWFERVEKITPLQYKMYINKCTNKNTPWKFFESNHQEMLETAQEWVKRTSESCSTVAVLIATVAFAAAYTVPGGSDEKGSPILIGQLFFTIFTITDVLALASSLIAVVMFLSILTSPFDITDFKSSLPNKLHLGFNFLFLSVAMTMLSFAATIILIVRLKKRWLTIVVYSIAFLPVSVLALLQLPFFLMIKKVLLLIKKCV